MGVSALAVSFFNIVCDKFRDVELYLLVGNEKSSSETISLGEKSFRVDIINFRMSPKAKIHEHILWILFLATVYRLIPNNKIRKAILNKNRWLRKVYEADFIGSIHGGDGFSDIYGLKNLMAGILPDLSAIIMKKELVLLPQTYGPYSSFIAKHIARFILNRSAFIISRDRQGLSIIKRISKNKISDTKCSFCPDMAFTLKPVLIDNPTIDPPLEISPDIPIIGINVNGLMFNGGYDRNNMFKLCLDYREYIITIINHFLETSNSEILLIPHTYAFPGSAESDPDACSFVKDHFSGNFPQRIHLLTGTYDQSVIKGIISTCDFFIGSRMHACIGALSLGIPTIGIAYSKKFLGVFESIGMDSCVIDARKKELNVAIKETYSHFLNRQKIGPHILNKSRETELIVQKFVKSIIT